jgi:hypothetical protein
VTVRVQLSRVERVEAAERTAMYELLAAHHLGTDPGVFRRDLEGKQWVILLRDLDDHLVGFSTQRLLKLPSATGEHGILFSGDTVVARPARQQPALAGAFGHLVLRLARDHPGLPLSWFLITKGFRTYRFLPLCFRVFHPAHDRPTPPDVRELLDRAARALFPDRWDPAAGLVRATASSDRLRPELAAVPPGRRADPHVRFFLDSNPGFATGDELACLASLDPGNLTAAAWRQIDRVAPEWLE